MSNGLFHIVGLMIIFYIDSLSFIYIFIPIYLLFGKPTFPKMLCNVMCFRLTSIFLQEYLVSLWFNFKLIVFSNAVSGVRLSSFMSVWTPEIIQKLHPILNSPGGHLKAVTVCPLLNLSVVTEYFFRFPITTVSL